MSDKQQNFLFTSPNQQIGSENNEIDLLGLYISLITIFTLSDFL